MGLYIWDGYTRWLDRRVITNWGWDAWVGIPIIPYPTYRPPILDWEVPKYAKYAHFGLRVWVYTYGIDIGVAGSRGMRELGMGCVD